MARRYASIPEELQRFIADQKIFFVATAPGAGRVNVSPKGMDALRVVAADRVVWLNLTGSGNETAAHVQENARMTLMFAAFEGKPLIVRLYGQARVIHHSDPEWDALYSLFPPLPGARQLFDVAIDLVQTSCGMGVPLFDYVGDRELLKDWAERKGEAGIREYWAENNSQSLDGRPTFIVDKNR